MELPLNNHEQKNRSSSFSFADGNDCSKLWNEDEDVKMDLYTACAIGQYSCVQQHLADGVEIADLDKHNFSGWTPLMYAAYVGHVNIVNLLLDNSVNVNSRTKKNGATPLMLASSCGNEPVVYFLLQNGAKIDAQDNRGWTSILYATFHGHLEVVKTLLDAGANTELREYKMGLTPLLAAAKEGHESIFEVLLRSNVKLVRARTKTGEDARSLALRHGNMAVVNRIDLQQHQQRNQLLRSEPGLSPDDTDLYGNGLDEESGYWHQAKNNIPMSGIRDGPKAFEEIINNHRIGPMNIPPLPGRQQPHALVTGSPCNLSVSKSPEGPVGSLEEPFLSKFGETVRSASLHEQLPKMNSQGDKNVQNHGNTVPTISRFLEDLKLTQYLPTFEKQDVDFNTLLNFTENDLKEVGITLFGPRRKISTALSHWKENSHTSTYNKETKKTKSQLHQAEVQLHETKPQVQQLQAQLTQENELRLFVEGCLLEEKAKRQEIFNRVHKQQEDWKHVKGELETLQALSQDLTKYLNLQEGQVKEVHDKLQTCIINLGIFVHQGTTETNSILIENDSTQCDNSFESSGSSSS